MEFIRVKKYTDPCFSEKKSKFKDELAVILYTSVDKDNCIPLLSD